MHQMLTKARHPFRRVAKFAAVLGVAITIGTRSAGAQELGIAVGSMAPKSVEVRSLDGKPVNLSRFVGKTPVVLQFWATWCPNCKELEPRFTAAKRKYGNRVRLVGVAVGVNQSPERVRRYATKHRMALEVVYDQTGAAADAFDVPATSFVVVLDARGKVVYTGVGGKQDIDSAIRKAL